MQNFCASKLHKIGKPSFKVIAKTQNKEDLKAQYINKAFERYGVNFEKHPEHVNMNGRKTGAQIRLEIMNILDMMDTDELTSIIKNLQVPTEIE